MNCIVVADQNWAIGCEGGLLFSLPTDMKRFRSLTIDGTVILGRKTLDSFPGGRPLPRRRNIVISRNASFTAPGVETALSLDKAIALCDGVDKVFVLGGAQIYTEAIGSADCLCLTRFDRTLPDADCFFPAIDPAVWSVDEAGEWLSDEKSGIGFRFETLRRKQ